MLIRLARTLPLLVAFIALQGSILGGAAACALGEHHPMDATGMVSAAPVGSSDGPAVVDPMPAQGGSTSSGMSAWASSDASDVSERRVPCDHERMPEHCTVMPACSVFTVPVAQRQQQVGAPASRIAPLVALEPGLEAAPPELPPPRA